MLGVYNLVIYNCTKYQSKLHCITDYSNKKNQAKKFNLLKLFTAHQTISPYFFFFAHAQVRPSFR